VLGYTVGSVPLTLIPLGFRRYLGITCILGLWDKHRRIHFAIAARFWLRSFVYKLRFSAPMGGVVIGIRILFFHVWYATVNLLVNIDFGVVSQ
jgi:hypothetical protein